MSESHVRFLKLDDKRESTQSSDRAISADDRTTSRATSQPATPDSYHDMLHQCLPILAWLPAYRWKEDFLKDFAGGSTVGFVLLAQSLAHASLCGVAVMHGPYSCMLAPLVYTLLGTCGHASVGTGGLVALLTGHQLANEVLALDTVEKRSKAAAIMSFNVGVILTIMGILRLSFLVRFLSRPALSGFVTASALLIMIGEAAQVSGLPKEALTGNLASHGDFFLGPFLHFDKLLEINFPTLGLSIFALGILRGLAWVKKHCKHHGFQLMGEFKELITLAATCIFSFFFAEKFKIKTVEAVSGSSLPSFSMPMTSSDDWALAQKMLPGSAFVALVVFLSSFAGAKKFAMKEGYKIGPLHELVALGLSNASGAFLGGVPVQIGLSRTALAYSAGVKTMIGSNIIVCIVVTAGVLILGPYIGYVPECVLGTIIFNAAIGLVEFNEGIRLYRLFNKWKYRKDLAVWVAAFLCTYLMDVLMGIMVAAGLSIVMIIVEVVEPDITILGRSDDCRWLNHEAFHHECHTLSHVLVVRVEGPLFYANVEGFQETIEHAEIAMAHRDEPVRCVILSAEAIQFVDSTALSVLQEMVEAWNKRDVVFYIALAYGRTQSLLQTQLRNSMKQKDFSVSIDECKKMFDALGINIDSEDFIPLRTIFSEKKFDNHLSGMPVRVAAKLKRLTAKSKSKRALTDGDAMLAAVSETNEKSSAV